MKRLRKRDVLFNSGLALIISIPICIAAYKSQAHGPVEHPLKVENFELETAEIEAETEQKVQLSITHEKVAEIATDEATEAYFDFVPYDFIPLDVELQVNIFTYCESYEIAYDLILSVIKTESEFQWIYGDEGNAIGYMQIWPSWWQETADSYGLDINNPSDNVHLGIIILTDALNENGGDLNKALKQYNSGNPNYEGNEYIESVFDNYDWILEQKGEL